MEQSGLAHIPVDEDQLLKSQMEKMAPAYDAYMRKITFGREHLLREATVSLAGVKPGDCVLEVGCGTGTLALAAKRRTGPLGKVYGIDLIPAMIELSQNKFQQAGEDATFQVGSIDAIPFPADQFDSVMCSFMIFHMSEAVRRKGLAEIHRVLKPQGRLLILDLALPAQPWSRFIARLLFEHMLQHEPRELLPVLEATGFTDLEAAPVKFSVLGLPVIGYVRGSARKN
jgi:ubiquinone/menaquinone biosynthesis C-methylase UbiE